jgi:hypothetical protein
MSVSVDAFIEQMKAYPGGLTPQDEINLRTFYSSGMMSDQEAAATAQRVQLFATSYAAASPADSLGGLTPNDLIGLFPWLGEIPGIEDILRTGLIEGLSPEILAQRVRQSPAYAERFPGMAARKSAGLSAISEAEYLALERGYQQQLQQFGALDLVGDLRSTFAGWIAKDVSVSELNARLDLGYSAVYDTGAQVKEAFQAYYGITLTDQDILGYFLNPTNGLNQIEDKILTAQVGGEALRFGLSVTRNRADELRRAGITPQLAREGFADVASELPMLKKLASIHSFAPLSQAQLEDFFFHSDPEIGTQRAKIFTRALAEFQGSITGRRTQQGGLAELLATDQSF